VEANHQDQGTSEVRVQCADSKIRCSAQMEPVLEKMVSGCKWLLKDDGRRLA